MKTTINEISKVVNIILKYNIDFKCNKKISNSKRLYSEPFDILGFNIIFFCINKDPISERY